MTRDAQEEARLLALAKAGDAGATERLLAPYQPLLLSLARRFQGMPQGELCQAGYVGLMEALRRYNGAQGARFVTYAVPWALGEMRRALRSATDSTGAMARRAQIARRQQALFAALGREPRLDELAQACRMTAEEVLRTLELARTPQSLEDEGEERRALADALGGGESISIEALDLRLALGRLSGEERSLLILRYYRDKTQKEAAALLGRSQAQVCRVERRALDRLRDMLA